MESPKVTKPHTRDPFLAAIVLGFVLAAFLVSGVHEPWADEAQAWLIARDATLYNLLFQLPHAELNPSLWHLMLIFPSTNMSYEALRYIALLFGFLGVVVFVYYSPFPKPVKLILPFGFFVFFQFTVVARSYCLWALVIFCIGMVHKHRLQRPLTYGVLVGLLAYIHSFSALASMGLIGIHGLEMLKQRYLLSKRAIVRNLAGMAIPAGVMCFLAYQVLPVRQRTLSTRWHFDLDRVWFVMKTSLNESFTDFTLLSLAVFLISAFWFWQRKVLLLYLGMITPVLIVFTVKFFNDWHIGLLFLIWILMLWISFESTATSRAASLLPYSRKLVFGCIYVVLGFHLYWGVAASYADYRGNYSCGGDVAQLLKQNDIQEGRVYARNFWSIAALPYFDGKMFYNINPGENFGYWTFFAPDPIDDINLVLAAKPDAIVLGRRYRENDYDGYVRKNFEGRLYWKDLVKEKNHCTVYIRKDLYKNMPTG